MLWVSNKSVSSYNSILPLIRLNKNDSKNSFDSFEFWSWTTKFTEKYHWKKSVAPPDVFKVPQNDNYTVTWTFQKKIQTFILLRAKMERGGLGEFITSHIVRKSEIKTSGERYRVIGFISFFPGKARATDREGGTRQCGDTSADTARGSLSNFSSQTISSGNTWTFVRDISTDRTGSRK